MANEHVSIIVRIKDEFSAAWSKLSGGAKASEGAIKDLTAATVSAADIERQYAVAVDELVAKLVAQGVVLEENAAKYREHLVATGANKAELIARGAAIEVERTATEKDTVATKDNAAATAAATVTKKESAAASSAAAATFDVTRRAVNLLTRAVVRLAAAFGVILGVRALIGFLTNSVKAFAAQEEAVGDLSVALQRAGDASDENLAKLIQGAADIQRVYNVADEAVLAATASVSRFAPSLNTLQLAKAQLAVVSLAEALKMDLAAAGALVGKALTADLNVLSRYGIEIDKNATAAQRLDQMLKSPNLVTALEQAAARSETWHGRLTGLKLSFSELKETIGSIIVDVFAYTDATGDASNQIRRWQDVLEDHREEIIRWGRVVVATVEAVATVFWNLATIVGKASVLIGAQLRTIVFEFRALMMGLSAELANSPFGDLAKKLGFTVTSPTRMALYMAGRDLRVSREQEAALRGGIMGDLGDMGGAIGRVGGAWRAPVGRQGLPSGRVGEGPDEEGPEGKAEKFDESAFNKAIADALAHIAARDRDVLRGVEGRLPAGRGPTELFDTTSFGWEFWTKLGEGIESADIKVKSLNETFGTLASETLLNFGSTFEETVGGIVSGSETIGEAFGNAIKGGAASAARAMAQYYEAMAIASLGHGLLPPPAGHPMGWAAAGKFFAAALAFRAIAGALGGGGGSRGSGGGGTGANQARDATGVRGGELTFVIHGGILDMDDPRQLEAFQRAWEDSTGRRTIIERHPTT